MDNFIKIYKWEDAPDEYRLLAMEIGDIIISVPNGFEQLANDLTSEWFSVYQHSHMNNFGIWYGRY